MIARFAFFCIAAATIVGTSNNAAAQNIPNGNTSPSSTNSAGIALPANYNTYPNINPTRFNYTRTFHPRFETDDTSNFDLAVNSYVQVNTTYTNGWGQTLQSVSRGAAGNHTDIISIADLRNITSKPAYLPYNLTTTANKFQPSAFTAQKSFYNSLYPNEGDNAYSRTTVSGSSTTAPTVTSYSAGASFTGAARGTTNYTIVNTSTDDIKIWEIDASNNNLPTVTGTYAAGALIGKKMVGQHGAVATEWTDKTGQLIYKTVDSNAGTTPYLLRTYYVYDELGQLVYIITPKAVDIIAAGSWGVNQGAVSGLCYYYQYNADGQVIAKTVPGKTSPDYTVYDKKHRTVLSNTPLLYAQGKWAFSVYDSRDRIRFSGYIASTVTRANWQSYINALSYYTTATDLEYYIVNGFNGTYPTSLTNCEIVDYFYYDDYAFESGSPLIGRSFDNSFASSYSADPGATSVVPYAFVQGLPTGKKTKVIYPSTLSNPPNQWIYSVNFYDSKGHVIQTQTLNPWNTTNWDVSTTQYQFTGEPKVSILQHYAWSGATKTSTKVIKKINYDLNNGKLSSVRMVTDNESYNHYLSEYQYDNLGRASQKKLGSGAEIQNYAYNIRGQLTGINPSYIGGDIADQHFGCQLSYDYGFTSPRYDGTIAGMIWRGTAQTDQAYGYNYDAAGRMTGADYVEVPIISTSTWDNTKVDYSVSNVKYDPNGNILSMKQRGVGVVGTTPQPVDMDDLTYTYLSNSNRLAKVADAATVNYQLQDFVDGANKNNDYAYDADGNLETDNNKGISLITYNPQDLPVDITTASNGDVNNIYDAEGMLVQKTVTFPSGSGVGTNPWVYRYCGPFVYRNDSLQFMLHDEGRARWMHDSLKFKYDFFVKDHLGNVRAVVTSDVSTSANDYLASYEIASANLENLVFENIDQIRDPRPYTSNASNLSCARLNGSNDSTRIGTSILLHVMTGDRFNVSCQAYYDTTETGNNLSVNANTSTMLSSIIATLGGGVGGFGNTGSGEGGGGGGGGGGGSNVLEQLFNTTNYTNTYDQIKENATNSALPRAYLNYIYFNEQMQIVAGKSGAIQIDASTQGKWGNIGVPDDITANQNGYLAVYISDEQYANVYFDNLRILHYRGRLLEEQHYYPHGLTIRAGANTSLPNRYLYQGKELQDEVGLQLYDFHARQYDPQIGRFWGIDPADQFPSGYTGMANDPANNIDPDGMQATVPGSSVPTEDYSTNTDNPFKYTKPGGRGSILDDSRIINYWSSWGQGICIVYRNIPVTLNYKSGAFEGALYMNGTTFGISLSNEGQISANIYEYTFYGTSKAAEAMREAEWAALRPSNDDRLTLAMYGGIAAPMIPFVLAEIGATSGGAWIMENLVLNGGKIAKTNLLSGGADLSYQLFTKKIGEINVASVAANTFLGPLPSAAISYSTNISLDLNVMQFNNPLTSKGITNILVGTFTNYGVGKVADRIGMPRINAGSITAPVIIRGTGTLGVNIFGNYMGDKLSR